MNERSCDLHLHSDCSDGEFPPARVVDVVADARIAVMALTDHDTTRGHAAAAARARERGIAFVGGIEMTAYADTHVVHVLGLGVRTDDAALAAANDVARTVWGENQRRWLEALAAEGFAVVPDRELREGPLRLPVLIARLCERGVDRGDARVCHARFGRFFAALPPAAYRPLPSPGRAAAIIRGAGGVAVLAHPLRYGDGAASRLIGDVDGVEADYAAYAPAVRASLRELASSRGKLYSCGSDYHGFFNGAYANPEFTAQPELLARLRV